jgi:regulator of sigma D
MLNQRQSLPDTPSFTHPLVDNWLTSRQALLISWHQLLSKFTNKKHAETQRLKALDSFCQKLVDYLSQGHFQQYQQIELLLGTENIPTLRAGVYPLLENNTYELLNVYDNELETAIIAGDPQGLCHVLAKVGELLELRFVLEDKLINALPRSKASPVISKASTTLLPTKRVKPERTKRI